MSEESLLSTVPILDVKSYRGLRQALRRHSKPVPDKIVAFRGQTHLHVGKLVPSIMRDNGDSPEYRTIWMATAQEITYRMLFEYISWQRQKNPTWKGPAESHARPRAAKTKQGDSRLPEQPQVAMRGTLDSHFEKLLQHYGGRSHYLDVTRSLSVALWFAHHVFHMEDVPLLPADVAGRAEDLDPFGPIPVFNAVVYERAWGRSRKNAQGYLLVLHTNVPQHGQLRHGDFVALTPDLLSTRIQRQKAALMYADSLENSGDLTNFVKCIFRFNLPLAGTPKLVQQASTLDLFPSPARDLTYRGILAAIPFRDDLANPFNLRRVVQIPEYHDSFKDFLGSQEWASFRACDVYHKRNYFFHALRNVESTLVQYPFETSTLHLRNACPVLTPFAYDMVWFPKSEAEFMFPDGAGFFFEYDPLEVRSYEKELTESRQPISVAVWIVRSGCTYWCRLFHRSSTGGTGSFECSRGHAFHFEEGQGIRAPQPVSGQAGTAEPEAQREFDLLTMTLGLLAEVAMKRRQLKQLPDGPYWTLSERLTG